MCAVPRAYYAVFGLFVAGRDSEACGDEPADLSLALGFRLTLSSSWHGYRGNAADVPS